MGFLASGALGGISQFPATLSLTDKWGELFLLWLLSVHRPRGFSFLLPFQSLLLGRVAVYCRAALKLQVKFKLNFWMFRPVWRSVVEHVSPTPHCPRGQNVEGQGNNWMRRGFCTPSHVSKNGTQCFTLPCFTSSSTNCCLNLLTAFFFLSSRLSHN